MDKLPLTNEMSLPELTDHFESATRHDLLLAIQWRDEIISRYYQAALRNIREVNSVECLGES